MGIEIGSCCTYSLFLIAALLQVILTHRPIISIGDTPLE